MNWRAAFVPTLRRRACCSCVPDTLGFCGVRVRSNLVTFPPQMLQARNDWDADPARDRAPTHRRSHPDLSIFRRRWTQRRWGRCFASRNGDSPHTAPRNHGGIDTNLTGPRRATSRNGVENWTRETLFLRMCRCFRDCPAPYESSSPLVRRSPRFSPSSPS